jgi:hypothetical protein
MSGTQMEKRQAQRICRYAKEARLEIQELIDNSMLIDTLSDHELTSWREMQYNVKTLAIQLTMMQDTIENTLKEMTRLDWGELAELE